MSEQESEALARTKTFPGCGSVDSIGGQSQGLKIAGSERARHEHSGIYESREREGRRGHDKKFPRFYLNISEGRLILKNVVSASR